MEMSAYDSRFHKILSIPNIYKLQTGLSLSRISYRSISAVGFMTSTIVIFAIICGRTTMILTSSFNSHNNPLTTV